jgi:hypothetical protein
MQKDARFTHAGSWLCKNNVLSEFQPKETKQHENKGTSW